MSIENKSWYNSLKKSSLTPPSWIFGLVWPILYACMAIALYVVWTNSKCYPYCKAVTYFIIQLSLNLIWTTIFFKWKKPQLALVDLLLIIAFLYLTLVHFNNISKTAYFLLIPYGLWLCFALYLNLYIVLNN